MFTENRIKTLRELLNSTADQVAERLGIELDEYFDLEQNGPTTIDQCIDLAIILETSVDYIVGLTNDRKPHVRNIDALVERGIIDASSCLFTDWQEVYDNWKDQVKEK